MTHHSAVFYQTVHYDRSLHDAVVHCCVNVIGSYVTAAVRVIL